MNKNMMTHCPTRMRKVFTFLLLIAASPALAQEDCDNIVTIPELAAQIQELLDAEAAVEVDTIIMVSEGSYEVQLSNGTTYTQVQGCTDPAAVNYDAAANTDDGSCASNACSSIEFDGYTYSVVEIGDQCWFAENLRTTTYADGSAIPEVTDNAAWVGLSTGARCDYDHSFVNVLTYGRLYNWYAVNNGSGLCPSGWHVPTDGEWTELEDYITSQGFAGTEGTALKSTTGWCSNCNGTDGFGFSALPGGYRNYYSGYFQGAGYDGNYGYWWSSSPYGAGAWFRLLDSYFPDIDRFWLPPRYGFSVRCLRDAD